MLCAKIIYLLLSVTFSLCLKSNKHDPLILTPFIESGRISEARRQAQVNYFAFEPVKSYSGFFTVDKRFNSNVYFWFFPAENDPSSAPIICWLQGGPGASSLFGLFSEIGPFTITPYGDIQRRKERWTKDHSVLFIDNPVGTGFSFTDENGYVQNQTIIGEHLYVAYLQFFQIFPELRQNDFFLAGESYAGKYVPAAAYTILKRNPTASQKINLKGVAIGNGFSIPKCFVPHSEYLYQIGLVDFNGKKEMKKIEKNITDFIDNEDWYMATTAAIDALNVFDNASFFANQTGFANTYNYLLPVDPYVEQVQRMLLFLERTQVRKSLHVGNIAFQYHSDIVLRHLYLDYMKSVEPMLIEVLNTMPVLIFTGQLDITITHPQVQECLLNLNFSHAQEYKIAEKRKWYVEGDLAGYIKEAGHLTEAFIRVAGHVVPGDQPVWALDMIYKFVRGRQIW